MTDMLDDPAAMNPSQRRHLWRASGRCVGPEGDSRPMDRMRAELPPCGRTTACAPSPPEVFLARGCAGACRRAGWEMRIQLSGNPG